MQHLNWGVNFYFCVHFELICFAQNVSAGEGVSQIDSVSDEEDPAIAAAVIKLKIVIVLTHEFKFQK